jgi:GGDEF domain-containing protein
LKKSHIITSGIVTLLIVLSAITIALYYVELLTPEISLATVVLLIIGLATGALLPNVVSTWVILLLTTIGGAILLLGDVPVSLTSKIVLLAVFPISAGLMALGRFIVIRFGWINVNRHDIERYTQHYDQVTKLQTEHNASKMYLKATRFIKDDIDLELSFTVTAIHWAHNTQFKQFHPADYDEALRQMARVLKDSRLPSESLYYLGHGTFLIISHQLSTETYQKRNSYTKEQLNQVRCLEAVPQFKWGKVVIDDANVTQYPTLDETLNQLRRQMETDLVVEYLQGERS